MNQNDLAIPDLLVLNVFLCVDYICSHPGKLTWQWNIPFLTWNTSSEGPFSIAMLVYHRIYVRHVLLAPTFLNTRRLPLWSHPKDMNKFAAIESGELGIGESWKKHPLEQ